MDTLAFVSYKKQLHQKIRYICCKVNNETTKNYLYYLKIIVYTKNSQLLEEFNITIIIILSYTQKIMYPLLFISDLIKLKFYLIGKY